MLCPGSVLRPGSVSVAPGISVASEIGVASGIGVRSGIVVTSGSGVVSGIGVVEIVAEMVEFAATKIQDARCCSRQEPFAAAAEQTHPDSIVLIAFQTMHA